MLCAWKFHKGDSGIILVIPLVMLDVVISQFLEMLFEKFVYGSGNAFVLLNFLVSSYYQCLEMLLQKFGNGTVQIFLTNQCCFQTVLVQKFCYGNLSALSALCCPKCCYSNSGIVLVIHRLSLMLLLRSVWNSGTSILVKFQ